MGLSHNFFQDERFLLVYHGPISRHPEESIFSFLSLPVDRESPCPECLCFVVYPESQTVVVRYSSDLLYGVVQVCQQNLVLNDCDLYSPNPCTTPPNYLNCDLSVDIVTQHLRHLNVVSHIIT